MLRGGMRRMGGTRGGHSRQQTRSHMTQAQYEQLPDKKKEVIDSAGDEVSFQGQNSCTPDAERLNEKMVKNQHGDFDEEKHELTPKVLSRDEASEFKGPMVVTTKGDYLPKGAEGNPYAHGKTHHSVNYQEGVILDQNPYHDDDAKKVSGGQWKSGPHKPRVLANEAPENFVQDVPEVGDKHVRDMDGTEDVFEGPPLFKTYEVREKKQAEKPGGDNCLVQ